MTVSSTQSRISHAGDGATTDFPVPFYFIEPGHLVVSLVLDDGTITPWTLGTDYSVAGAGNQAGGTVTAFDAPAVGETLIIERIVPSTQETAYQENDPFPAKEHERALDKLTMVGQQHEEVLGLRPGASVRVLRLPASDPGIPLLPDAATRAGKALVFDEQGHPTVSTYGFDEAVESVAQNAAAAQQAMQGAQAAQAGAIEARDQSREIADQFGDIQAAIEMTTEQAGIATVKAVDAASSAGAAQESRAGAEAARDIVLSYVTEQPGRGATELAGDMANVFALDATEEDPRYEAKLVLGGASMFGRANTLIPTLAYGLKLVTRKDGLLQYNNHNLFRATDALDGAQWQRGSITVVGGQPDSRGGNTAWKLTANGVFDANVRQAPSTYRERWIMYEAEVSNLTSGWCWFKIFDGTTSRFGYFNLTSGVFGTVDSGLIAQVRTTRVIDSHGTEEPLPAGWFALAITIKHNALSTTVSIGPCDANGSLAVTNGRAMLLGNAHLHYGRRQLPFLRNPLTAAAAYGVPEDWSLGERTYYLERPVSYTSVHSDDLTQTEWVKTDCAATLDTTGPHGEPSSTLTATADNATCLQTTVNAWATQAFYAHIRRKSGAGTISITMDGGATWKDVTAQVNSSSYTRVSVPGVANPTFGFRLGTSGDAIEVALAATRNTTEAGIATVGAPIPIGSASSQRATLGDVFEILANTFPGGFATSASFYVDYYRPPGYPGFEDTLPIQLRDGATNKYWPSINQSSGDMRISSVGPSITRVGVGVYRPAMGERMEISASVRNNQHTVSVCGEIISTITDNGMPTLDRLRLLGGDYGQMFVRRLILTPTFIDPRELRLWRYSGRKPTIIKASQVVALDRESPNSSIQREPVVLVLEDDGEVADIQVFWSQRHDTGWHPEAPWRTMQRRYRYHYADNQLVPVTPIEVCNQQGLPYPWADGQGHIQSHVTVKVPYGPYKGRLLQIFTQNDAATSLPPGKRNVYARYNDLDGDPAGWSAPVLKFDAQSLSYPYIIGAPSGDHVILPVNHPNAGRVCIPSYMDANYCRVIYTDNFGGPSGTDWQIGPLFVSPTAAINEASCALRPDGVVIYTFRHNSDLPNYDTRVWATSNDGITLVNQGLLPDWEGAEISASMCQMDPTGETGPYGKIAMSRAENMLKLNGQRSGCRIDFATDADQHYTDPVFLCSRYRAMGYSSLRRLKGGNGKLMALATEDGYVFSNVQYTVQLHIIDVTAGA